MNMKRNKIFTAIGLMAIAGVALLLQTTPRDGAVPFISDHGYTPPVSATGIQTRQVDKLFSVLGLDHGNVGVFCIPQRDFSLLISSLNIIGRHKLAYGESWPSPFEGGFDSMWDMPLEPVERIDCTSSVADAMRIWIWDTPDAAMVVRVSTWWM